MSLVKVFISHPTPCNSQQKELLRLIHEQLDKHGLVPVNLGKNNWNYKKPLEPIRNLILECKGAIIVAIERHHNLIGYEREMASNRKDRQEFVHKYTSSPWIQIEGGMAYQAGVPLLILKEKKIYPEGILDPNNSDSYIFDFDIGKNCKQLSPEMEKIIESWIKVLK